jgi:hypothetical protein
MSVSREELNKLKCVFESEGEASSRHTSQQLMPFASTCFALARNWILQLGSNKHKYSNKLNKVPLLRIKLSNIKPNIK